LTDISLILDIASPLIYYIQYGASLNVHLASSIRLLLFPFHRLKVYSIMPIPSNLQPINRFSMREEVYHTLLGWIMEGELRPGEKILDKDLVESSANRWTRVAEISLEEPEMIYPILWTLEELAVAQAIDGLSTADFDKMEAINQALDCALDADDPVAASRADAQFHDVYIDRSNNPFLINILHDLKIRYRRVEVTYFAGSACAKDSVAEHRLILDALTSGSLVQVQSMIRSNWKSSLDRLKRIENKSSIDRLVKQSLHPQS
jgi:DNA-binding GntR family transcriptional regulator